MSVLNRLCSLSRPIRNQLRESAANQRSAKYYPINGCSSLHSLVRHKQTDAEFNNPSNDTVHLSAACVSQLRKVASENERLRLTVDSGGCSGFEYKFALDSEPINDKEDIVINQDGVQFVVDHLSMDMIKGATIDFEKSLIRASFRVTDNPQSEGGCSCGASFAPKL